MNAKKCKQLRAIARDESHGWPLRRLIASKQDAGPMLDRNGKWVKPYAECAVNDPESFRGRYRELKKGRVVNFNAVREAMEHRAPSARKPVERAAATNEPVQETEATLLSRAKEKARLFYRRFVR